MTRTEAIKILSVLKAAYPNSYRGMTKEEGNGVVSIWEMQFAKIPYFVVSIAVNKLISTNTFPPTISEVNDKLQGLYWEAKMRLDEHKRATIGFKVSEDSEPIYDGIALDDKALALVKGIINATEPMMYKRTIEPSLDDMLPRYNSYLPENSDTLKLK